MQGNSLVACALPGGVATAPIWDFKLVHMSWEQLPVGEWADYVLVVYLAVADARGWARCCPYSPSA